MDTSGNEFDKKARAWDADPEHVRRSEAIADAVAAEIPFDRSMTAMEYGCGTGLLSFPLRNRFSAITLLDSSQGMLDIVQEKIKAGNITNMRILNTDLLKLNEASLGPFSVIYNALVLHHVADVERVLGVWYSLLTAPGYLCIVDLDSENGMFHGPEFKGHNGFDRSELETMVKKAGFIDVRFKTVYEISRACRDGISRDFPVFLMFGRKK